MSVKSRIKIFIQYYYLSITTFEKSINASNGYINSISKSIGLDKLESILEKYPSLNLEWLITGNGSMLKDKSELSEVISQNITGSGNVATGKGNITGNNNSSDAENCKALLKNLQIELHEFKIKLEEKDQVIKEQSATIYALIHKK